MPNLHTLLNEAKAHLDSDEKIMSHVMGLFTTKVLGQKSFKNGIFIATDKKLFFYSKGVFGYSSEMIPLSNISSFKNKKGLLGYEFTFYTSGNDMSIRNVLAGEPEIFLAYLTHSISNKSNPDSFVRPEIVAQPKKVNASGLLKNKKALMIIAGIFIIGLIGSFFEEEEDKNVPANVSTNQKAVIQKNDDYTIVNSKDVSYKGVIRKEYRIVVPTIITKERLKEAMENLVAVQTRNNPDIDAIIVFAYDRKADSEGAYTFGRAEWAPNGDWGSVTRQIGLSNDRATYRIKYDILDKVGKIEQGNIPTKREFEIYDTYDKELWADPDANEDMVKNKVAKKLGISGKELDKIYLKVTEYKMK